jgi:hypothetical protein
MGVPNEVLAVLVAEGVAVLWLIFRIDSRLAVIEAKIKYLEQRLGLSGGAVGL